MVLVLIMCRDCTLKVIVLTCGLRYNDICRFFSDNTREYQPQSTQLLANIEVWRPFLQLNTDTRLLYHIDCTEFYSD